jgi:hypothetical protein
MDEASVLSSFSLSPGAAGFFSFSDTRESFTFTPLADWITGKTYTATLGKTCLDREGNSLEEERTFQFRLPPVPELRLLSAATSTGYILQPAAEGVFVDPRLSIEKNEKFTFAFSRSVPPESRDSIIKFNPPVLFDSNWGAGGKTCDVTFPEHLHWGAVYEIRAAELLYRFLVNGAGSVPLGVSGVAYISDTSVPLPVKEELLFAHNYGFSSSPSAAFEVLVTHGPGRLIVLGSFLEAFDLSASNGCMRVETLRVEIFPAETETLFRVHCEVENLSETGTLRISVDEKLRDDRENNLPASYALQVNKQ